MCPNTVLTPHKGWGNHSNYVLRCHYGLIVSKEGGCTVSVNGQTRSHRNDEWIVFDDSLTHSARNDSDTDRIVLIVDILRPKHVQMGTSMVKDTQELIQVVKEFHRINQSITSQNVIDNHPPS
jgi:aspartyl/asparaginyl beta-hydroxylase (cupin superfamily)